MNYYERYCGDYVRDTAHLGLAEHGAYTVLLDIYYATERPLPAAYDDLYRMCRAMNKAEQQAVRRVVDQFFPIGPDGLRHNDRCDREILKAAPRIAAARNNGKGGGRKPKAPPEPPKPPPPENPPGNPLGSQQGPDGNPPGNPAGTQQTTHPGEAFHQAPNTIPQGPLSLGVEVDRRGQPHQPNDGERDDAPKGVDLPPRLRRETWDLWLQHRREKGAEVGHSERAITLVRLAEYDDPNAAIERAITAGLRRIDPPEQYRPSRPESLAEKRARNIDQLCGTETPSERQTGTVIDLDPLAIRSLPGDLRESDGNDVGRLVAASDRGGLG